jgi:hypothetical protein
MEGERSDAGAPQPAEASGKIEVSGGNFTGATSIGHGSAAHVLGPVTVSAGSTIDVNQLVRALRDLESQLAEHANVLAPDRSAAVRAAAQALAAEAQADPADRSFIAERFGRLRQTMRELGEHAAEITAIATAWDAVSNAIGNFLR